MLHHILNPGMVPCHLLELPLGKPVAAAVADVDDGSVMAVDHDADQCSAHPAVFTAAVGFVEDMQIGPGGTLFCDIHRQRDLRQGKRLQCVLHKSAGGKLGSDFACPFSAHAVAQHSHSPVLLLLDIEEEGILVDLAYFSFVCDAVCFHWLSLITLRRSCPQEALTSLPSLRRTVTFTPLLVSISINRRRFSGVDG